MAATKGKAGGVSDEAVQKATGRSWKQWFTILDRAKAQEKSHKEIARWLTDHHGKIGGWWCQMVTVAYEQERGLRDKHQKADGYAVSKSKTFAVPLAKLYQSWSQRRARARWLQADGMEVRKATQDKSMRITWVDGRSSVDVSFSDKGPGKSQVSVQHSKLTSRAQVDELRAFWTEALEELEAHLGA